MSSPWGRPRPRLEQVQVLLVLGVDVEEPVGGGDLLEGLVQFALVVHQEGAKTRRHEHLERRHARVGECLDVACPDVLRRDSPEKGVVDAGFLLEQGSLFLQAVDRQHQWRRIRHLDDGGDAAGRSGRRPRRDTLLVLVPRLPEVYACVDETR